MKLFKNRNFPWNFLSYNERQTALAFLGNIKVIYGSMPAHFLGKSPGNQLENMGPVNVKLHQMFKCMNSWRKKKK